MNIQLLPRNLPVLNFSDKASSTIMRSEGFSFKAIGGARVKKTCHAYFVELITVVPTLFTECQNSTRFERYDQFNFWGLHFYIGNRGGNFW